MSYGNLIWVSLRLLIINDFNENKDDHSVLSLEWILPILPQSVALIHPKVKQLLTFTLQRIGNGVFVRYLLITSLTWKPRHWFLVPDVDMLLLSSPLIPSGSLVVATNCM
jgi:hypothetical protein